MLASLLTPSINPSGVYCINCRARPASILATITDFGWHTGYIEGWLVNDKQTFLLAIGQALAFPTYYGRNWDAFEEMVNDLSWLTLRSSGQDKSKGCILLYDEAHRFATAQPREWQIALAILQSASTRWQQEGIAFYVLLNQNRHWNRYIPRLRSTK